MSLYSPLPADSVRFLRLLPGSDDNPGIRCNLITCKLLNSGSAHLYEALSYVWGPEDNQQSIEIDGRQVSVKANLYAALLHLQDRFFERILWVDAICINQNDNSEKAWQVQCMARIYAKASGVIVWLGEATHDSDQAFQALLDAAETSHTDSEPAFGKTNHQPATFPIDEISKQAVLTLLERPWFQRIWVLQEVAAARHLLIKCGSTEVDGYAFCLGLDVLNLSHQTRRNLQSLMLPSKLQSLVLPTISLMRGTIFRRQYNRNERDRSSYFSLNVRPLKELVDMYHTREATDRRDKVYALLGMGTDNPSTLGLLPDYERSWEDIFRKLVELSLSSQISVKTWDDAEVAIIEAKGHFLGRVSSLTSAAGRQHVGVTWGTIPIQLGSKTRQKSHLTFQASAKPIETGDLIYLLPGAPQPTIIRLQNNYLTIVMVAIPRTVDPTEWSVPPSIIPDDLRLIWDWGTHQGATQRELQTGKDYVSSFMDNQITSGCSTKECQCQHHLHNALKLWNLGLFLNRSGRYEEAEETFRDAAKFYGSAVKSGHMNEADSAYYGGREVGEAPGAADDSRVEDGYKTFERLLLKNSADHEGLTALSWAAKNGCEVIARLLLGKGANTEMESFGRTPLSWAVINNHEPIVRLLLDKGADVEATDMHGRRPLMQAVTKNHETVVRLLLDHGADFEAKSDDDQTPILWAASWGYEAVVKHLLDKGANFEVTDGTWRQTPLSWAAQNGHEATVQLLLDKGAGFELENFFDQTPLSLAADGGHETVVQLLLDKGANFEAKGDEGRTPLILAAWKGHEAIVRLLLDRGADIEAKDEFGRTPILWAATWGQEAVVQLLLDRGADVETTDTIFAQTPLSLAAGGGHEATVQLLLDQNADFEANDKNNRTPLSWAAHYGHKAVVQLLLDKGAGFKIQDSTGMTPLSWGAMHGREATVRLLLDNGADFDTRDSEEQTPLSLAAARGHKAVVKLLLDRGADFEAKDKSGQTLISLAAGAKGNACEATVRLLLEKGADCQVKDQYGYTPLLYAVENNNGAAIVQLFLDRGAGLETRDREGQTLLSLAARYNREATVRALLDKGADLEAKDENGRTPLSHAVGFGNEVIVRLLLDQGADLEARDTKGRTPLLWAVNRNLTEMMELLLDQGADVDAKDINGRTSLSWAAANGQKEAVRLFLDRGADVEARDKDGQTPLSLAKENWAPQVMANATDYEIIIQVLTLHVPEC